MLLSPILLPAPRHLNLTGDTCALGNQTPIVLPGNQSPQLKYPTQRVMEAINRYYLPTDDQPTQRAQRTKIIEIVLRILKGTGINPQSYQLSIKPQAISIEARDEAGIFYGCCTLIQLIQYYAQLNGQEIYYPTGTIPCLEVEDWPDFSQRGVMLDISRDKVPTMKTLLDLVDMFASWKINQLQLYTEHTFAYEQHRDVWVQASPFTADEIRTLDTYCRERFIELVPNQNSFGHLEHWLKLPRYRPLAEAPDGFDFPWGHHDGPFSLCPLDEGSIALLQGLYDELLPNFSSRQLNVGCDETFDLGQGRSKAECERLGTGRVYLDFLLKIYHEVKQRGFQMQFWGDIIMAHPELVPELPKDCIALEWGYEADHPFAEHGEKFAQAGLPFYVCPGTSAWNSIAGRTDNCLGNLANAAKNGLKYGADGYLITDWGDNGHWQTLPISYLGFAAGAAQAWCHTANQNGDFRQVLSRYAFVDESGDAGTLAYDLGNVYHTVGIELHNASALFYILQLPVQGFQKYLEQAKAIPALEHTLEVIQQLQQDHHILNSSRPDRALLQREFDLTFAMLQHAVKRGLFGFGSPEYSGKYLRDDLEVIIAEYQQVWLGRNRPGGLKDSLAHFTIPLNDYT